MGIFTKNKCLSRFFREISSITGSSDTKADNLWEIFREAVVYRILRKKLIPIRDLQIDFQRSAAEYREFTEAALKYRIFRGKTADYRGISK